MPVEQVAQPCEVCGVETTRRCSSCLEAGISLFFCGKDHQKLVWPGHKTVCGPGRAHPFVIVALSDSELAWAKGHLDVRLASGEMTLREEAEIMGGNREPAEALLDGLVSGAYRLKTPHNKFLLLTWIRNYLARRPDHERITTSSSGHTTSFCQYLAAEYCAVIIARVNRAISDRGSVMLDLDDAEWYSLVQHRALLISRLEQLSRVGSQALQYAEWVRQMKQRLFEWIRAGAGCADAKMRRKLANFRGPGEAQSS
ncbi:hypothetical protein JCM8208_002839 [Rhodotorula glutinis]